MVPASQETEFYHQPANVSWDCESQMIPYSQADTLISGWWNPEKGNRIMCTQNPDKQEVQGNKWELNL